MFFLLKCANAWFRGEHGDCSHQWFFRQMGCWIRRWETSVPCPLGLTPCSGVCKHITSQAEGCSNSLYSEVCCRPSSGYQPRCVLGLKTMYMDSLPKWWGPPISELILHQFTRSETSPPYCPWPLCSVGCRDRLLFSNPPAMQARESLAQRSLGTAQVWKQGSSPGHAIPTFPQDNGDRACTQREGRKGFGFGGSSRIKRQV